MTENQLRIAPRRPGQVAALNQQNCEKLIVDVQLQAAAYAPYIEHLLALLRWAQSYILTKNHNLRLGYVHVVLAGCVVHETGPGILEGGYLYSLNNTPS